MMESEAPRPVARTNSNLSNLSVGPACRGALEKVDLVAIRGWCLSASNPALPVSLDIECEGISLGQVRTSGLRKELSERLGSPAYAGLIFHWSEASNSARTRLIEHLSVSEEPSRPITLRLSICDAEPALELDTAWAGKNGLPSRADLLKYLRSIAARPRQTVIAQRESLLRSLPAPRSPSIAPRVRTLAFYLPQFHPIAENDEWWGKGFTEWTGVSTAKPLFEGHDQPRVPADLGYYDLRTPGVIEQQIDLARSHGLAGFCFHHYWFSGRRLLEKPLERFLEIDHDFGFCLCWANEPWSRRWDGSEKEVLVAQEHSLESDIAFIHDVLPMLQDRRYIRVGGKPILIVYRVGLLSDPPFTFERWRQICIDNGLPGLHVCMAETFKDSDPYRHGADSAVQFPPHGLVADQLTEVPGAVPGLHPEFEGKVYDYSEVVANEIVSPNPDYPRYSTLMGGWDNTSRRGLNAHVCAGFTPELLEIWLEHACERTERRFVEDERLLFFNAWNEWGEGTYLEPDRRYGRRCLDVVRNVLYSNTSTEATLARLQQKLGENPSALADLDRLAGRIESLERAMNHALVIARRGNPPILESLLTPSPPLGLTPLRSAGMGGIERLGMQRRGTHCVLRRGQTFFCSGWAIPADRALQEFSPGYLKLTPVGTGNETNYGFISSRVQRDDVMSNTRVERRKSLWSGFRFTATTEQLAPGTYSLSMLFPSAGSDVGCAIEVMSGCTLEIVP